jgi:hypothetical protein
VTSLAGLCLDLFLLGHAHLADGEVGDGLGFERRVRGHLDQRGLPTAAGFRVFGRRSLSGLYHQLDEQTSCPQALIVGEWKSYTGRIPKNDLLRFKAATDDYWLAAAANTHLPVMRLFGGTGTASVAMRTYAAHWGIVLITPDRWPIPTLSDPLLLWSSTEVDPPSPSDQRTLASLVRPLSTVLQPCIDGSWRTPPMAPASDIAARCRLWESWSAQAWACWDDAAPGRFSSLLERRVGLGAAA